MTKLVDCHTMETAIFIYANESEKTELQRVSTAAFRYFMCLSTPTNKMDIEKGDDTS